MLSARTSATATLLAAAFMAITPKAVLGDSTDRLSVIVPLAPGGALDRVARTVEQFLPQVADVTVTVENYSPKKGEDGYQEFMHRPADGSSVLAWFEPAAAAYQPGMSLDDLTIINVQEIEPPILVASRQTGWRDLRDMISAVREAPSDYRLGIGGRTGGGAILSSALLANLDLDVTSVTYGSGGKARKGLARGEVHLTAGSLNAVRKLGNKVTALAVFSPRRLRSWPDVPTLREALGPEADQAVSGAVYRFFAVHRRFAEDKPEAFQALVENFRRMTEDDAGFRENVASRSVGAHWFGPTESTSLIQRSHQHFRKLITELQAQ